MKKIISVFLVIIMMLSMTACLVGGVDGASTSTEYRYEDKFLFSRLFFNDFAVITDDTFAVPGLETTQVGSDFCSTMTPQGLCVTEDYVFISAYCSVEKYVKELEENISKGDNAAKLEREAEHETHNSVIYIIDRENGEYIKNIVLEDANHVGGLATDGKVIYVAKSSDEQVSVIKLSSINKAIQTKSRSVKVKYDYTVDCGCTASFVTWFDGLLWVGVFNEKENGELNSFKVNSKNYELTEKYSLPIPAKANGACFTEIGGDVFLAVNSSYGRKNISEIHLMNVTDYGKGSMAVTETGKYFVPPTVQNCDVYDGKVYYLYESGATCYSKVDSDLGIKSTTFAVDRVCVGDVTKLFNTCFEGSFINERLSAFAKALSDCINNFIKI